MRGERRRRLRSLAGVIAAMAVVNLVYGITFPLLALVLDGQGTSKTLIGISTVTQAAAILAIAPLAPRWLARHDPARIMQWAGVSLAGLFILAGLWQNVWFWFPLRFVIGALTALLWIASEALINTYSEDAWRGRVTGIYSSVGAAGFAIGPLLLIATGSEGFTPFLATAILVAVSALPLFMVEPSQADGNEAPVGLWRVIRLAPVIMLANVVYAASAESLITFFPLFGVALGLGEEFSLFLMTVTALGGMVLILPLGWLADRVNRMGLMAACVALTTVGFVIMPWAVQAPVTGAMAFVFLFGGVEGMVYALGVALIGERFKGAALAAASTAFTTCWGVGTIIGPLVSGAGMDAWGAESLAWVAGTFFALFLPLPLWSWWRTRRAN